MNIQETVENLEQESKRIDSDLTRTRSYPLAYFEMASLLEQAIVALRQSDPAFGLQVMSYDQIIDREA